MSEYRLFSWGANSHGQLGHGKIKEEELLLPQEVDLSLTDLKVEDVKKIVGGAGHTLVLDENGKIYSCGWNDKGQAGKIEPTSRFQKLTNFENQKIIDVACGWDSSMALSENGDVFVWGSNSHGQLGSEKISIGSRTSEPLKLDLNEPILQISMGLRHSALVTRSSKVLVSGASTKGQLGINLGGVRYSNKFVEVSDLHDVTNVACGQHHTVILTKNNSFYAWGDNKHGQLGIDPTLQKVLLTPIKIDNFESIGVVNKIYCGWTHSAFVSHDRRVYLWGRNSYGQLGREKNTPVSELWRAKMPVNLTAVHQLSIGSEHNIVLTDDNNVLTWGWNEHGNCGNGSTDDIFVPTKLILPKAVLIGSGAGHSFAVVKTNL